MLLHLYSKEEEKRERKRKERQQVVWIKSCMSSFHIQQQ